MVEIRLANIQDTETIVEMVVRLLTELTGNSCIEENYLEITRELLEKPSIYKNHCMIETSRCKLLMIQDEDFDNVKKLYVDERVRKYLGGIIVDDHLLRKRFVEILEDSRSGSYYWTVREHESYEFIGLVSLDKYHDGENMEVSYQFLPKWWGFGYATEVISMIIDFGFKELGLQAIVAETQSANLSSCRLLERVGMTVNGNLKRFGVDQTVFKIERPCE